MKPLFRWAGGKTKIIKRHYGPHIPQSFDCYIEPFFGGGAMFIKAYELNPHAKFVLNDINESIMGVYIAIKNDLPAFVDRLKELSDHYLSLDKESRKDFYYLVRKRHAYDYLSMSKTVEAGTLYFLLKTGFNGVWQINKNTNNRYGTPCGLLNEKSIIDEDNITHWHRALQNAVLSTDDFYSTLKHVSKRSFVFLDPPYRGSMLDYETSFTDDDQKRVLEYANFATQKNAHVLVSNRDVGDSFFEKVIAENDYNLHIEKFDVAYTAGRKRKTNTSYEAQHSIEYLIHNMSAPKE